MLVTGASGVLGQHVTALLGERAMPFDRTAGQELLDARALSEALIGCDAIVHLAALHPLVAPPHADHAAYEAANVTPFRALLDAARAASIGRVVLASSTSVWREAPAGAPARFVDDDTPADDGGPYAMSKRACERMLDGSAADGVVVRLARFASDADPSDEVRKLYRAIDPRDAAALVVLALDRGARGVYAGSAPTPFLPEDAPLLGRDPRAVIRTRTGREPSWCPPAIGSVVVARRAAELGWAARYPSALLPRTD